jgi:DNA-binding response OmpR family regulator
VRLTASLRATRVFVALGCVEINNAQPTMQPALQDRRRASVLVVEDEHKVANALREGLEAAHCSVRVALTGEEGFFLANRESFDLVVLDLMLPGCSGAEVLTALRRQGSQPRVLVLTARDAVEDRVDVLDLGADDYLVKPFAFPELLARVRALLRRGQDVRVQALQHEDLEIDVSRHYAARSGVALTLTAKEFEIVEYLLRHRGSVVSRETLAREIWKIEERATPLDNVIDVTMARLRRKLDDPFERKLLHTVRGLGFMLGRADA